MQETLNLKDKIFVLDNAIYFQVRYKSLFGTNPMKDLQDNADFITIAQIAYSMIDSPDISFKEFAMRIHPSEIVDIGKTVTKLLTDGKDPEKEKQIKN